MRRNSEGVSTGETVSRVFYNEETDSEGHIK